MYAASSVGHWLMVCQEFWVNCYRLICSDEDNITVGRWWTQWVHMAAHHCYLWWSWWSDTCEQFFLSLRRLSLLRRFPCIFIYIYICSANSLYVLFTWLAWHLNPGESTWFFSKTPSCETWEWDFHWRSINEWSMVMVFRSQDFAEVGSVATWYIRLVSPTKGWLLEWAVFYYNNNNNNIHLFIIYLFWVFLSLSSVAVSGLNYCYIIISNSCELLISYSQVEY